MAVEKATADDLAEILDWLEQESKANGGEGFWCNRETISSALTEDDALWVIRRAGKAVAFQVGKYAGDIVCVRQDAQRQGLGTELFEASLTRAIRDRVNVLSGECSPSTSWPFWQKLGFEPYSGDTSRYPRWIRRILRYDHDIPKGLPSADVTIEFYSEEVLYENEVKAFAVHSPRAGRSADGSILLEHRVLGLRTDVPTGKDMAVKITVDGAELCLSKAKHQAAKHAGVEKDQSGNFYIDVVRPDFASRLA